MNDPSSTDLRLVRKQILITGEQNRLLVARSRATNVPVTEIVRAALDRELGIDSDQDSWRQQVMAFAGSLADEPDLEATVEENRGHLAARATVLGRTLVGDG